MTAVQILDDLKFTVPASDVQSHYRRFNNSLIHYEGDIYLMTYRMFLPGHVTQRYKHEGRNSHPWSSNWSAVADEPIIAVLRKTAKHTFRVVREIQLSYPKHLRKFADNFQDARITRLHGNFYLYGQAWVEPWSNITPEILRSDPSARVRECLSETSDCALVAVLLQRVHFDLDRRNIPVQAEIREVVMPCLRNPATYQRHGDANIVEKNWCFFEHGKQVLFEYMLTPHIVFSLDCRTKHETESPISAIRKSIGCGIFFSPGGPLVPWSSTHLIGCGHVKYKYKCTKLLPLRKGLYMHPTAWGGLVYGMFFYLVERTAPYRITAFSNAFLPFHSETKYTIVFPMACIHLGQNAWAVSYGDGDDTSDVMVMSRQTIETMLAEQPRNASEFRVDWLPANLKTFSSI